MTSGQKYYMDEEICLENCLVHYLIDAPHSILSPPATSMLIPQLRDHKRILQRKKGHQLECVNILISHYKQNYPCL